MTKTFKKGDTIKFTEFNYVSKAGDTSYARKESSVFECDVEFDGIGVGKVIQVGCVDGAGRYFIVKLDEATWKVIQDKTSKNEAYVSEFDLVG